MLIVVKNQTYCIDIFKDWKIHIVFHVSLLEKIVFKRKEKISLKLSYQSDDINIEKNEKFTNEIFWIKVILNNKNL